MARKRPTQFRKPALLPAALALCAWLHPGWCCAADLVAEVEVKAQFEPETAVGLLLSKNGTTQVLDTEINKLAEGAFVVSFPYKADKLPADVLVTAVATSKDGEVAFGGVKALPPAGAPPQALAIPDCPQEEGNPALHADMTLIEKLIEIRAKQRANRYERLTNLLDGDFLEKLRKFEKGFGLASEPELGPDLNPYEMVDRLSRLLSALGTYAAHKQKPEEE